MTHTDRRRAGATSMWRTRILVGALSICQGLTGALFADGSIVQIVERDSFGVWWCYALMLCGALMLIAAVAEARGETNRWCREFSASMLGAMWLALFFEGVQDGAWTIALIAPLYFGFCVWAYWAEAKCARAFSMAKKQSRGCDASAV